MSECCEHVAVGNEEVKNKNIFLIDGHLIKSQFLIIGNQTIGQ